MLYLKKIVPLITSTCLLVISGHIYAQTELTDGIHEYEALSNVQRWKEPRDTETAINNPDLYAWQLFTAMNWPVDPEKCEADSTKKLVMMALLHGKCGQLANKFL